jgi:hypothetical protein
MTKRALLTGVFTLVALFGLVQPDRAYAQSGIAIPIVGSGPGGTFTGIFNLQRFRVVDGAVTAIGTLTGTATTANGTTIAIVRNLAVPTAVAQASCAILNLDLGPLFLDVLGLQVDLSRIVLDVVAQPGAGNLLGNLLCAVTGLLDSPGGLARLLNQILGILG